MCIICTVTRMNRHILHTESLLATLKEAAPCYKGENKPPLSSHNRASIFADKHNSHSACWLLVRGSEMKKQSRSNQPSPLHSTSTQPLCSSETWWKRCWITLIWVDYTFWVNMNNFLWQKLICYCTILFTLSLLMGSFHSSLLPTEMGLTWAHSHFTCKFLNCVKPIFAVQTIMCSAHLSGTACQKDPHTVLYGMRVPRGKLNQRSHSCSVVPSVDKGWAVWSDRTVSMFSTDGCLPGPQFDDPAEG